MIGLWPARNTAHRDPNGTVRDFLGQEEPPRVVYPYSDVESRSTYVADETGRPQRIPAERLDAWLDAQHELRVREWFRVRGIPDPSIAARAAAALRGGREEAVIDWLGGRGVDRHLYDGIRPWLDRDVVHLDGHTIPSATSPAQGDAGLPFSSPRAPIPGEPEAGLRARVLPYPTRDYGRRPQAYRLHTCVACSYGKFDRYERNFDLCRDCHRVVGSIPTEIFRQMRAQLERRGLVEERARSFAAAPGFDEVARALTRRWRAEHLQFGTSAGEPFVVYPQSFVVNPESERPVRRTLLAGPDGRPLTVPAESVRDEGIRPIRGRYPRAPRPEGVDLAEVLGAGLARTEDELMLAGERSARTEESRFETESETGMDAWSTAASLSDFGGQRPIEVLKGSGLSREEISELSDSVERAATETRSDSRETPRSRARGGEESLRHLRGHADPLFSAGPAGETLTRHALASALTPAERDGLRTALVQSDWTEALHEDRAWDRHRIRAGISSRWREHSERSGPLAAITPPSLTRGYAGPTGVDEELGPHEHSRFLSAHQAQLDAWLTQLHNERVGEWLKSQRVTGEDTARELAFALRHRKEADVHDLLAREGIPLERYEAARAWLDEASPAGFARSTPALNPAAREIGDLTPAAPIWERFAARDAEPRNWRDHGSAQTPRESAAAIAEFRTATAPAPASEIAPTSGMVAVQRGDAEAPMDFANARARVQEAREAFDSLLPDVFADPGEFRALFSRVSSEGRRTILETMRTSPATLAERFGPAARLAVDVADRADLAPVRHGSAAGAQLATVTSRARDAARMGRTMVNARRDLDRARRAVLATRVDGEALLQARIAFHVTAARLFADPRRFQRAFAKLPMAARRTVVAALAERPASVAGIIGPAGRLAPIRRIDSRWGPLAPPQPADRHETARAAAEAGQAYVSQMATVTRTLRQALSEGRASTRAATLDRIAKHFPGAAAIDTHAHLSTEIDRLQTEITSRRADLGHLDRMHHERVATAAEFRRQIATIVVDPETFIARFRELPAAEKHRVFDVMADRPQELVQLPALGASARLQAGASRFTRLVAQHGHHNVESASRFREHVEKTAVALRLPPTSSRGEVRSALEREVATLSGRAAGLAADRSTLPQPDLGRATAHWQALGDAERAHATLAFPHLARAIERVEQVRETGASAIGRQRGGTALKEHSGLHRARNKPVAGVEL